MWIDLAQGLTKFKSLITLCVCVCRCVVLDYEMTLSVLYKIKNKSRKKDQHYYTIQFFAGLFPTIVFVAEVILTIKF